MLELVHSDVCDSNDVLTRGGKRYFITFFDDFSKYCCVYLINHKSELFDKFKVYKIEVENQLERKIKILRSNRGGEYTSLDMSNFCEMHGIIHEVAPPYALQSNGISERKNRTLLDMVNAMLVSSGLPKNMWVKLYILHVKFLIGYLINFLKKPFTSYGEKEPNLKYLKV